MSREENVIKYYVLCNKLKDVIRTGWKVWNVERERLESVAEHIFGVQMLAIAMKSEYEYDIDIKKTIFMLAIHELGETIIGDLTQFQISHEEKEKQEHEAVANILRGLIDGKQIEELFLEFDAHQTKEAMFAYQCDKLECDLQCKLYDEEGCVELEKQKDNESLRNELVQKLLVEGDSWSEMWLHFGQQTYPYDDNFKNVSKYALNNNIKTKNNIYFSRFALKTILTNPVYAKNDFDMYNYFKENNVDVFSNKEDFDGLHGIMAYNKTLQVKHKAIRKKDIHQWIVACGKHKGIIDGRDWIYVQNILNINKQKSYRKPKKNTAILTGMIFCKECGSPMRPRIQTGRLYKDGTEKYVYSCTLKEKSRRKKCTGKNINGNEIDTLLLEKIKKIIVPNQKICDELKKIANTKADIVDENDEFISLKSKYDKNQKDLENLIQKIRYVDIDLVDDINKEVKKIKKENEEISIKLNKYNEERQINKLEVDVVQIVLEIIENHFNKFNKLDTMEQKALLRLIINKVSGNGDTVEVNLLTDNSSAFFNSILLPSGENSK